MSWSRPRCFECWPPLFRIKMGKVYEGPGSSFLFGGHVLNFPLILSFGAKSEQASPHSFQRIWLMPPNQPDLQTGGSVSREPPREAVTAQTVSVENLTCFGLQRTACDLVGIYPLQSLAWPSIFAGLQFPHLALSLRRLRLCPERTSSIQSKPDTAAIGRALN